MSHQPEAALPSTLRSGSLAIIAVAALALPGCMATAPTMGGGNTTVTGAASGGTAEGNNSKLERCTETLGTLAMEEDVNAPWYVQLRQNQLGSTLPVLRLMVQQSNCFVIVERGAGMEVMMRERQMMRGEEGRAGSNMGGGQMVAADYLMRPSIQFSGTTGGGSGGLAGLLPGALGVVGGMAGSVGVNEASTTLLLVDVRSGVQVSASEGSGKNFDFGFFGGAFTGGLMGAGGGYSNTPKGKIVVAAFADSFNQMVKALRNYKAQSVKGGLGTGGRIGVQGGQTEASRDVAAPAPAPAARPAAASPSATPAAKTAKPAPKPAPKPATTTTK